MKMKFKAILKLLFYFCLFLCTSLVFLSRLSRISSLSSNFVNDYEPKITIPDSIYLAQRYSIVKTSVNKKMNKRLVIEFYSRFSMGRIFFYDENGLEYLSKSLLHIELSEGLIKYSAFLKGDKWLTSRVNKELELFFPVDTFLQLNLIDTSLFDSRHLILDVPNSVVSLNRIH